MGCSPSKAFNERLRSDKSDCQQARSSPAVVPPPPSSSNLLQAPGQLPAYSGSLRVERHEKNIIPQVILNPEATPLRGDGGTFSLENSTPSQVDSLDRSQHSQASPRRLTSADPSSTTTTGVGKAETSSARSDAPYFLSDVPPSARGFSPRVVAFKSSAASVAAIRPVIDHHSQQQRFTEVWKRAVTVAYLLEFTDKYQCWGKRTWQVVETVIKPMTVDLKCRWVELPEVLHAGVSGTVETFVSHTWGGLWGDLVAAVSHGMDKNMKVWVDIFAILQHSSKEDNRQGEDLQQLGQVVSSAKALLLVCSVESELESVNKQDVIARHGQSLTKESRRRIPFTRVWCLFEIINAIETGIPFILRAGTGAGSQFSNVTKWSIIVKLINLVDVKNSEATIESDKSMILGMVEEKFGHYDAVNGRIRGAIVGAKSGAAVPEIQAAACGNLSALDVFGNDSGGFLPDADHEYPPLVAAAAGGYDTVVDYLVNHMQADVNAVDIYGGSPLVLASMGGHVSTIVFLLSRGASIDHETKTGGSALHGAVQNLHIDAARVLLENGALSNVSRKSSGRTPLVVAVAQKRVDLAGLLLDFGADIEFSSIMTDGGYTPLAVAVREGDPDMVRFLLSKGADPAIILSDGRSLIDLARESSIYYPEIEAALMSSSGLLVKVDKN